MRIILSLIIFLCVLVALVGISFTIWYGDITEGLASVGISIAWLSRWLCLGVGIGGIVAAALLSIFKKSRLMRVVSTIFGIGVIGVLIALVVVTLTR